MPVDQAQFERLSELLAESLRVGEVMMPTSLVRRIRRELDLAGPAQMSDSEIDALLAPGRAARWKGDGRQYDRDTARLVERHLRETHR